MAAFTALACTTSYRGAYTSVAAAGVAGDRTNLLLDGDRTGRDGGIVTGAAQLGLAASGESQFITSGAFRKSQEKAKCCLTARNMISFGGDEIDLIPVIAKGQS
jgi:hypothetical protein